MKVSEHRLREGHQYCELANRKAGVHLCEGFGPLTLCGVRFETLGHRNSPKLRTMCRHCLIKSGEQYEKPSDDRRRKASYARSTA